MIYNREPIQDPCGTPQLRGRLSERALGMETRWLLADKYDLNQFNGAPEILNEVWSLRNKTLWSSVSKAALKSSNTSRTACWKFISIIMSLVTFKSAVSILWFFCRQIVVMGKDYVCACDCQFDETQLSRLLLRWSKDCLQADNS